VSYWLYSQPHRMLPDPEEDFKYWDQHIWASFANSVEDLPCSPQRGWLIAEFARRRRENGMKDVDPIEDLRRRAREHLDQRMELLNAWTLGLSYDVAVFQANYVIDRRLGKEGG